MSYFCLLYSCFIKKKLKTANLKTKTCLVNLKNNNNVAKVTKLHYLNLLSKVVYLMISEIFFDYEPTLSTQ